MFQSKKRFGFSKNGCISSQKDLGTTRQNYKLKIHSKEKELLELQQAVDSLKVRTPENLQVKPQCFL